ncbi:MAG: sigma 54-interacting transcriptional regulator [Defluviitaleaceae bacterium]|nr:sigma 54-interacting transcriptional regulator [Defluviitaleaceae bacterium]
MEEKQLQVGAAWDQFWNSPDSGIPYDIREEILESWKRSKQFGIDPYHMEKNVLSPDALEQRIKNSRILYDIAVPIMDDLHSFEKGSGFLSMLCDAEGYVLRVIGEKQALMAARQNLLLEGACRSEQSIGTNAIGTCIYLKKFFVVNANEHYYKPHNTWMCAASPIFNSDKQLVGVLCLSAFWDRATYHTPGLVVAATEAISKQVALQESFDRLALANGKLSHVVELMNYGVIIAKKTGEITQINSFAIMLLNIRNLEKDRIIGTNINNYIPEEQLDFQKLLTDNQAGEVEFNVFFGSLQCAAFLLTGESARTTEVVVTIRKTEHVYKMVNRIVGSSAHFMMDDIIGRADCIEEAKKLARVSAPYMSNVLLVGESGTGKELFAQAIHNASPRANAPFVALNCGALPRSLIEAELFGYEGGTFTGSKKDGQAGKFELANGGSIFLDEIGDMPFDVQVNLLRVLQTREVVRIGGKKSIPVDVRIIAATNRNLSEGISNNTFRQDLYYRLNVFSIHIPSLRERTGDVRLLCDYMLMKYSSSFGKSILGFTEEAYRMLEKYNWPGNVRELENIVERSILVTQKQYITPADLPANFADKSGRKEPHVSTPVIQTASMQEEELIRNALAAYKGNIRKVSDGLGLSRATLYRKIKKYNIDFGTLRE